MRRKIKDSVIENLNIGVWILFYISFPIMFCFRNPEIVKIYIMIWFGCFAVFATSNNLAFLNRRNDKIDEEEKARQKKIEEKLKIEEIERIRTQSQIWVNE